MKKRSFSRFAVLIAASLLLTACPKKPNEPPVADTELQSSVDVCWATFVVSDIYQMCGFAGERVYLDHFYHHVDGSPAPNTFLPTYNQAQTRVSFNFNETQCVDGKKRSGEVRMDVTSIAQQNAEVYHAFGFEAQVSLLDYQSDGWHVTSNGPAILKNELVSTPWDPRTTNLVWSLEGNFEFVHPTDANRNLTWQGKLMQVLTNTADNRVFSATRQPAITWSLAAVGYHGAFSGVVLGDKPYTLKVTEKEMLVRDMTCSPELLGVSASGTDLQPKKSEFHPFSKGIATLELQGKYPRRIYFGNEASTSQPAQCDNTGQVMIKGLMYKLNFMR